MYKYKLKETSKSDSYSYKGRQLKKNKWYESKNKLAFPDMSFIEEFTDEIKQVKVKIVEEKNYELYFKELITPIRTKGKLLNFPLTESKAKMYIIQEKKLVKDLDLTWNSAKKGYIKKFFFKEIFFYGYSTKDKGWVADVKVLSGQTVHLRFYYISELKYALQKFIQSNVTI